MHKLLTSLVFLVGVSGCYHSLPSANAPSTPSPAAQTPITDETYTRATKLFLSSCMGGHEGDLKRMIVCACGLGQTLANTIYVVKQYHLQYEEELTLHAGELMLSYSQVQVCIDKGN